MSGWRFVVFFALVLAIWAAMHAYVFYRLSSLPCLASWLGNKGLWIAGLSLWACYPLARIVDGWTKTQIAWLLEYLGACWMGVLFLLLVCLLLVDVITVGGLLLAGYVAALRGAAAVLALCLSAFAFVQAVRTPVITSYEVSLKDLPPERDGVRIAHISDLHVGNLLGPKWVSGVVSRVNKLEPDLILAVGDIIDGNVQSVSPAVPALKELKAPLGCWAVTGNHEFYAGLESSLRLLQAANFKVLRDSFAEVAPGLVLVGVDDLTARKQRGEVTFSLASALTNRPPGATVLLSHSPLQAEVANAHGVGLMLSGHTHSGQIWPFTYLVKRAYPLVAGRYQIGSMTAIVCRGTGTWGPRMRLWHRSEIVLITLRSR